MLKNLRENINFLKSMMDYSVDFTVRELVLRDGTSAAIFSIDGMVDKTEVTLSISTPLITARIPDDVDLYEFIRDGIVSNCELVEVSTYQEFVNYISSGFAAVGIDGYENMLVIGVQGFPYRGVSEPASEMVFRGSREGFSEPIKINITMVRRRIKNPDLVFKSMEVGDLSKTPICLCYIKSAVSSKILKELEKRLKAVDLDTVLASGYLVSYLTDRNSRSLFSTIGVTERPDTLCGKITEGRIGILVDGTPAAIIVPHLFIENFQSFDDYSNRPYFASFIRILKYISFLLALYMPGLFVAITNFHLEYLPTPLLNHINDALRITPFPLMVEVLIVAFMYEVMREAGLRLPKTLSHAVSIVGALVIGETGVSAGLISAPTLIFVAFSAICSYVIPELYGTVTILKFGYIVAGGMFGLIGIVLLSLVSAVGACSLNSFGVPYFSPIAPVSKGIMSDNFIRSDWHKLSKHKIKVQNMTGAETDFEK
ncbi:MAG: spore germination protein [Ruminococcus sp.]|nr:spore germination protein [Ruminococcus sp.]